MITHLFAPTKKRAENNAVHAKTYLHGLLSETPRKNSEAIADVVDDTQAQDIQNFMTGSQWEYADVFAHAASPVYGERDVTMLMRVVDLHWKPAGGLVRFVLVIHPTRGRRIFLCTDTTLEGIEVVRIYGVRFKIEVTFKHAVHSVGTWCYHFWMAEMKPLKRRSGNQYMHMETEHYRQSVRRKLGAYHCFLQMGVIAQGLLQMLAILYPDTVWRRFGSWLRTVRQGVAPSEQVVALALRECLPEFIAGFRKTNPLAKIISENLDVDRAEGFRLAS